MSPPYSNSNWIWSQDHNKYYRQELVNGQWVTLWQGQEQPTASTAASIPNDSLHQRNDSANFIYPTAPQTQVPAPQSPNQPYSQTQSWSHPYQSSTTTSRTLPTISQIPQNNQQWNLVSSSPHVPTHTTNPHYSPNHNTLHVPHRSQMPRGIGGTVKGSYIYGQTSHYEEVDPTFYVRDSSFFAVGKYIAILLTEEAGSTVTDYNSSISRVRFGQIVHTQARRFIIVRAERGFCYACPIFTYSGRATTKPGIVPNEHAIAYSDGYTPTLVEHEAPLRKDPICVVDAEGVEPLRIASRIFFGIHHPIQHNVKVKDLGQVHSRDVQKLRGYFNMAMQETTGQGVEDTATGFQEEQQRAIAPRPVHGTASTQNHSNYMSVNHAPSDMRVQPVQRGRPPVSRQEDDDEDDDDDEEA